MDFFSIIGTIASIGSIPLSLFLFIKSKENNIDKVKRDIVKIFIASNWRQKTVNNV